MLRWVSELQGRGQFLKRPIWARVFLAHLRIFRDLKLFERFWCMSWEETQRISALRKRLVFRNPTQFASKNMPCCAKPNAIRFKEYALLCEPQRNSLQVKRVILRNPTQFPLRTTQYFAKPNAISCKEHAVFSETQRKSLRGKRRVFRNLMPSWKSLSKTLNSQKIWRWAKKTRAHMGRFKNCPSQKTQRKSLPTMAQNQVIPARRSKVVLMAMCLRF